MRNLYSLENTMSENDYEVLGRYHAALDAANSLIAERHNTASQLSRLLSGAFINSTSNSFNTFDHVQFIELSNKITELNIRAGKAVEDVNTYADKVGKSKIHVFK